MDNFPKEEYQKWYDEKIVNSFFTLSDMMVYVCNVKSFGASRTENELRHLTLLWIKQMLEEGKIKGRMALATWTDMPLRKIDGWQEFSTPLETITEIEKVWNSLESIDATKFEMFTQFTNPKNDWSKVAPQS